MVFGDPYSSMVKKYLYTHTIVTSFYKIIIFARAEIIHRKTFLWPSVIANWDEMLKKIKLLCIWNVSVVGFQITLGISSP